MTRHSTVFLMYHELEVPGRKLVQTAPGYIRYVVSSADFRAQMQLLKSKGWSGVNVSQALAYQPRNVAITFDDGCETDLILAAPILQECGFGATFYITTGFLGNAGYLSELQLCELCQAGFEIGCHSMTHPYLSDLNDGELRREIGEAKSQLELIIGRPVEHFSCPGGRHNSRVSKIARESGYKTVATSRMRANSLATDRYALGRVAVLRGTSPETLAELCAGRGLRRRELAVQWREGMKRVLGNSAYDRLRSLVLRQVSRRG